MNRYALAVGINEHDDDNNIQALRFAVQDVRSVDHFLTSCGFQVHVLMDSEATCAAVEQQLHELSERPQAGDLFVFASPATAVSGAPWATSGGSCCRVMPTSGPCRTAGPAGLCPCG